MKYLSIDNESIIYMTNDSYWNDKYYFDCIYLKDISRKKQLTKVLKTLVKLLKIRNII